MTCRKHVCMPNPVGDSNPCYPRAALPGMAAPTSELEGTSHASTSVAGILFGGPSAIVGIVSPTVGGVLEGVAKLASGFVLAPYGRGQERETIRGTRCCTRA